MSDEELRERFLAWRGVDVPCKPCGGSGQRAYGSTAARRGGIGGQTLTGAVCDYCWGSGDADRPGADLRKITGRITALETALRRVAESEHSAQCVREGIDYGPPCICHVAIAREALRK